MISILPSLLTTPLGCHLSSEKGNSQWRAWIVQLNVIVNLKLVTIPYLTRN